MSNDILLAKPILPSDFIDCSVGEPYLIRDNLSSLFPLNSFGKSFSNKELEYQRPNGFKQLVDFLEEKHQAPVIICNGAKQAVGSLLYAIKKNGGKSIGLRIPYWALFKPLIEMHGLNQTEHIDHSDSYLLVHPNNPDGFCYDNHTIDYYSNVCTQTKKPLIHDGAYYSHVYLPRNFELKPIGDVQVFTFSKLFGLSGLRIGYSVFHNTNLYKWVMEYMEHMTVGVSSIAQMFAYDLVTAMHHSPDDARHFEDKSYWDLYKNKQIASHINPKIIDTHNIIPTHGMFLWTRCYNLEAFKNAKINIIDGTAFGAPGFIRMNLALHEEQMIEVVNRLNKG